MLDHYLALRAELTAHGPGAAASGAALCVRLTATLDATVATLLPARSGRLTLVAVGGYGRGEMCLHSDIDLMLLHAGQLPTGAERTFYPLWDAGLKVGHAVRSVREAVQAAREDLHTLTGLLDARLVAGDTDLYGELRHAIAELLRRNRMQLPARLAELEAARRTAEPFRLQQPNLKDGRGGLRALHGLHWDAHSRILTTRPDDARVTSTGSDTRNRPQFDRHHTQQTAALPDAVGTARRPDPRDSRASLSLASAVGAGGDQPSGSLLAISSALAAHHDVLLASRNALHAVSGKVYDLYAHDLQHATAEWLGVDATAWSQRLYLAIQEIDRAAARHWAAEPPSPEPTPRRLLPAFLSRRSAPAVSIPAPDPQPDTTSVLTQAAHALERSDGPPFSEAQSTAIRSALGPSWSAADREGLLTLLRSGARGRDIMDVLDTLGWLERAVPEWSHVRGLPQYAQFHLHTVDQHLWRTVEETLIIARRDSPEPVLAGVAAELDSLDDALLAGWLHDIGKGWPGDHAVVGAKAARDLCRRARFGPRTTATVHTAIEQHLLLPLVATRRDIDDPAVIRDVADAVRDQRTLRVLYLLSVADSRATGPAVWSGWKASLLHALYTRTDDELRRRERAEPLLRVPFDSAPLVAAVQPELSEAVVHQHLGAMPPGYTDAWTLEEIAQHLRLMWPPPTAGEVRLDVRCGGPADEVTLAVEDRPGLLSTVSGVLALHDIAVLGGRFTTRADGVAAQAFVVDDALGNGIDEGRWARVRRDIPRALGGELDLEHLLEEKATAYWKYRPVRRRRIATRVTVDPRTSERATLVEVHAEDRAGLLHAITRALFDLRLDIQVAKVDTLGQEVVDVFYVRDLAGHPPRTPDQCRTIEQGVLRAVSR